MAGYNNSDAFNGIYQAGSDIQAVYHMSNKVWEKQSGVDPNALILEFNVVAGVALTIPFQDTAGHAFYINWGDGNISPLITSYRSGDRIHTYTASGVYKVSITGTCKGVNFSSASTQAPKLVSIDQWGNVGMSLMDYSFRYCSNLTSLPGFPSTFTSIGHYAFAQCSSLISITISSYITYIGNYVFRDCTALTSINIPTSVTSAGSGVLYGCTGLTAFSFPTSLTTVSSYFCYGCTGLVSVTFTSVVTTIQDDVLGYCSNAALVIWVYPTTPPALAIYGFESISSAALIKVPAISLSAYRSANRWSNYSSQIVSQ